MVWFNRLKQENPANFNVDTKTLSDQELDDFIEGVPTSQVLELRVFRKVIHNDSLARGLRGIRKNMKRKLPLIAMYAAVTYGMIDAVEEMLRTAERYQPAAIELVKRRLKEKVAKW